MLLCVIDLCWSYLRYYFSYTNYFQEAWIGFSQCKMYNLAVWVQIKRVLEIRKQKSSHSNINLISSPLWILDFLCDKVEGVPSRVGEQSWVQSQSDGSRILRRTLKHIFKVLCVTWKTQLCNYYETTWRIESVSGSTCRIWLDYKILQRVRLEMTLAPCPIFTRPVMMTAMRAMTLA